MAEPVVSRRGDDRQRALDAAIAQIEATGLVSRVSYVPGGVQGRVVGQTPDPGTVVRPGDTITIFVA